MRKTGVDVVGDMPWGTHFCLFYETRADLLETLVSYCKAGLENQEFCLWVVAEPLAVEDARRALQRAVLNQVVLCANWTSNSPNEVLRYETDSGNRDRRILSCFIA